MHKLTKFSALLGLVLLPACGPQSQTSNTNDIDIGNHNPTRKPPYITGSANLVYDPDESSGMSDLEKFDVYFLWDQYHNKIDLYYGDNVGTPDLGKSLKIMPTEYSTEWRLHTDKEMLAFLRYDSFEDERFFSERDGLALRLDIALNSADGLSLVFRSTELKTQEFDRGSEAEDTFKALLTAHGLSR